MANLIAVTALSILLLATLGTISGRFTGQFEMDVNVIDEHVDLTWTFNSSQKIIGFRAVIFESDSQDSAEYESSLLDSTEKRISISHTFKGGSHKICIVALTNVTEALTESCEDVEITDLKIVVGILAGVVFLIPCLTALVIIIYKDKRYIGTKKDDDAMEPIIKNKDRALEVAITVVSEKTTVKGHLNAAFVHETKTSRTLPKTDDVHKGAVANGNRPVSTEVAIKDIETAEVVTQADVAASSTVHDLSKGKDTTVSPDAEETVDSKPQYVTETVDSKPQYVTDPETDIATENSTKVTMEEETVQTVNNVEDTEMRIKTDNVADESDGVYRSSVAINVKASKPISDRTAGHDSGADNSVYEKHMQPAVIEVSIPDEIGAEHV